MKDGKRLILDITRTGGKVTITIVHQDETLYGAGHIGEIPGPPRMAIHSTKDLPPAATYRHVWIKGNASHAGEIVTWFDSGIAAEAWVDRLEELVDAINGVTDHIPDAGEMVGTSPNWEIGAAHDAARIADAIREANEAMDAEDAPPIETLMELTPEETFRTALATVRYAAGRLARVADELAYSSDDYIADEVASVNRLMTDFARAAKFFQHAETRQTVAKLHTWTPEEDTK